MNILYLDWSNKRPKCSMINNIKDYNYKTDINIRGLNKNILVCGNLRDDNDYKTSCVHYTKKSFLQSHLQKNIRKMNLDSVKTAKHIIDLDPIILLRRLPIIMFEDVIPHDGIKTIIWLMIAVSKGYNLKIYMVEWLLGMVYWLTKCPSHDNYDNTYSKIISDIDEMSYNDKTFIHVCLFRISYGGMKCDMCMIKYFIDYYIMNNKILNNDKIYFIKSDINRLEINEWDIAANDFHCDHRLINNINKQYPNFDMDYIKHLVWTYSSSKNNRIEMKRNKDEYKDWKIIKKYTRYLQKNMVYY